MVRLRSGQNRLNAHMHKKYKLVPSPLCPCREDKQTAEHVLQRCKKHDTRSGPKTQPSTENCMKVWKI
ncbi:hypothetical protein DPMN_104627 [Dreissena polymorpha]|uniref:Uncharacterized protein n=1 Tax=Dreissena polymorpha TaxID=45954 RepID=A0A9D4HFW5_DREPO|nr:hypothetical protein DPMN_104627 [Dreissena polymorpha]